MSRTQKKANCSLKEIAEKLVISKGAVSLALNDSKKISATTKKSVQDMAKKLGYKKNPLVSRVMSSLKGNRNKAFLETIVLINANIAQDASEKYPIFAEYIKGINEEAQELGYVVYPVWLHEPSLSPKRLCDILTSRGIRGGVIIGHINDTILPEKFVDVWQNFKFVSAGLRTFNPTLDFISADKFLIARYATEILINRGYKRPALVIDEHIDELVEGRFVGGFLRTQLQLPENARIPPFTNVALAMKNSKIFFDWISKYKPDAIFTVSNYTANWIKSKEVSQELPSKTKFVELERKSTNDGWIAIDKNYELVGRLAVRKLFELLNTPTRLKDINVPTATIVQPSLNKSI